MDLKNFDKKELAGFSFIFIGLLYVLQQFGLFAEDSIFLDIKVFPFYVAIIFLIGREFKIAAIAAIIGAVMSSRDLFKWVFDNINLLGLCLIVIGAMLIFSVHKNKIGGKKDEQDVLTSKEESKEPEENA
jgi:hypothetical protein